MANPSNVATTQEIIAEMQYLLGVSDDYEESALDDPLEEPAADVANSPE